VSGLSQASATIEAPAGLIWTIMIDLAAYGEWNPFILRIRCPNGEPARAGDPILLRVRFGNGREFNSPERIVAIEPPVAGPDGVVRARLEYEYYNWAHKLGLVRGRRVQMLTQAPGGPTEYATHERIHGALAFAISARAIEGGFRRHARALKQRAEALAGGEDAERHAPA
jgi:hypothetical protein